MRVFPISLLRAYKILQKLPNNIRKDDAIEVLSRNGLSRKTALTYLRALKYWGLIKGENELEIKKVSLDKFLSIVRNKTLEEIDPRVIEAIKEVHDLPFSYSIKLIENKLREKGLEVSLWYIRNILRLLKSVNIIVSERKLRVVDMDTDIDSIILSNLYMSGGAYLHKIISKIATILGIERCEIKKKLANMIREGKLGIDCEEKLLELWIWALDRGHCDEIVMELDEAEKYIDVLNRYPELYEKVDGKIIIKKIMDGQIFIYPL